MRETKVQKLERMLVNIIDANYGTAVHDIGNGDGLSKEESKELQNFWETYLEKVRQEYVKKKSHSSC